MKAIGLDLGTKSLGLALSDKLGLIASPYKTLKYESLDALVDELLVILESEKVEAIALGYPKNMNNTLGDAIERTMTFKEKLEKKTNLKIELIDERLSTVEATNYLLDADVSRKKRKDVVDAVAASIILDTYLRSVKNNERS